jgi:hypothetical protein
LLTPFAPEWALLVLLSSGVIAFILAVYLFNWDSKTGGAVTAQLALLALIPFVLSAIRCQYRPGDLKQIEIYKVKRVKDERSTRLRLANFKTTKIPCSFNVTKIA